MISAVATFNKNHHATSVISLYIDQMYEKMFTRVPNSGNEADWPSALADWWVVLEFCPQEGVREIPVPKWSEQGDALDLHLKNLLNFEKFKF